MPHDPSDGPAPERRRPAWPPRGCRLTLALLSLLCCLGPPVAEAHMEAKPIERWGPLLPGSVTCLRLVSRAAQACFTTVLGLEMRCREAQLRGEPCDAEQLEAEVDAATQAARGAIAAACSEGQLTEVGYFGFADANADLLNACVVQAKAAAAATYAPSAAGPNHQAALACMSASAAYASKVMTYTLERVTPLLERMATRVFLPEGVKTEAVRQLRLELSATRQRWIEGILDACPAFVDVYGRSPDGYLRTLSQCTDCVLSKTYINSAFTCVAQICGNGIPEAPEQCDDGNAVDTDGCRNNCTATP